MPAWAQLDLAKEGYVHLLPANRMHAKLPGDGKEMLAARRRILMRAIMSRSAIA